MAIRTKEFYKFQNKVLEQLSKTNLSPNESKYCWTLFRETCGYGNYKAKILRSKVSDLTGIRETHVSDVETRLKSRNIIIISGKNKGFNPNIVKWEKVQVSGPFKKVQVSGQKGPGIGTKKVQVSGPIRTKKKENSKEGENCYRKLSGKEIDKLEGDSWYKAIMWNEGKFSIFYIQGTIDDYPYDTRMSCWYLYREAVNIRNKEAYFTKLLRDYSEKREE